jgi:hypothetical protein
MEPAWEANPIPSKDELFTLSFTTSSNLYSLMNLLIDGFYIIPIFQNLEHLGEIFSHRRSLLSGAQSFSRAKSGPDRGWRRRNSWAISNPRSIGSRSLLVARRAPNAYNNLGNTIIDQQPLFKADFIKYRIAPETLFCWRG